MIPAMILMPIATKLIRISSGNFLSLTFPADMTLAGLAKLDSERNKVEQDKVSLSKEKGGVSTIKLEPRAGRCLTTSRCGYELIGYSWHSLSSYVYS